MSEKATYAILVTVYDVTNEEAETFANILFEDYNRQYNLDVTVMREK